MDKLWAGRFQKQLDEQANDFNASIHFDSRMYKQDILGSLAHVSMLAAQGIVTEDDCEQIQNGLSGILADLEQGALEIDCASEDIHSFVETELVKRIGDVGKKLHTARSRNDQVALDLRLYLLEEVKEIDALLRGLIGVLCAKAEEHAETVMPGYTHLQRGQPVTFGHHLMAYAQMLLRDIDRLKDCARRMNISPLGSCALAGTTFKTDRAMTAKALGMTDYTRNSMDGVSDRDFAAEIAFCTSMIMMHLSRFSEEVILWSSWEFKFIDLDDAYSTGSSIMPQKKNPDIAELVRGKTGRVYGDLLALLTMLKGLPLAYNKDMQEDKDAVFEAVDTVKMALGVFAPMIDTMSVRKENMRAAAEKGFITATDCADYLAAKGLPFRTAYKITGEIVAFCIQSDKTLETLTLEEYQSFSDIFETDIYDAINLETCVKNRTSAGGTAPQSVLEQVAYVKQAVSE
ncbi:MAG: argininosuccinate lyase [Oscillospiraceae bacterium]|jgi:argininosuccinate lyase|nr:argininosuccinate lyase [Oscillospiraceae bacterium]